MMSCPVQATKADVGADVGQAYSDGAEVHVGHIDCDYAEDWSN